MVFCNQHIAPRTAATARPGDDPRHPSQLYEAALEGVVLFLVLRFATHRLQVAAAAGRGRPGSC